MFDRIEALCLFSHHKFHSNANEHLLLAVAIHMAGRINKPKAISTAF